MKPRPAPVAIGRWYTRVVPLRLAVMAASTRMHSRPSRKTSTPMSMMATVALAWGAVGSGLPPATRLAQTAAAASTTRAAASSTRAAVRPSRVMEAMVRIARLPDGGAGSRPAARSL